MRLGFDLLTGFSLLPIQLVSLAGILRRARRHRLRRLPLHPPADRRSGGRGRLHPVRDPVRLPRHPDPRRRSGRRVRRPHLSRGAPPAGLSGPRRPPPRTSRSAEHAVGRVRYQRRRLRLPRRRCSSSGAEVAAVFTHDDDPGERDLVPLRARSWPSAHGLPVFADRAPRRRRVAGAPARLAAGLPLLLLLPPAAAAGGARRRPARGALNLHGSLLPRYRGRCPVNWVLIHGERETGVTLHYMVAKPDAGDIVAQRRVPIADDDTALTLYRKLTAAAAALLRETYPALCAGTAPRLPQDHRAGELLRRPRPGRRAHRLARAARGDLQPGARRHPSVSRGVHRMARRGAAGLVGAAGRRRGRDRGAGHGGRRRRRGVLVQTGAGTTARWCACSSADEDERAGGRAGRAGVAASRKG